MESEYSSVKEVRENKSATVVVLAGEIDLHQTPDVHQTLVTICDKKPPRVVINLDQVTYMDSSGVGTLVEAYRRINAYQGTLNLCCMNDQVHSIFEITRLDQFFKIYETEQEAIEG